MQITCPHCGFSKQLEHHQLPQGATRANCPKCRQSFILPAAQQSEEKATDVLQQAPKSPGTTQQTDINAWPKAGFWMRLVAALIDAFIVFVLHFLLGSLLALAGALTAGGQGVAMGNILILIQLFGYVLSFAYYIVFTGYCGQTPGKMALRIKVIRRDGSNISYGRAAFREVPAKFISGIIFGIGYLMVAFDEQKQGLHDRMADTYVIKL